MEIQRYYYLVPLMGLFYYDMIMLQFNDLKCEEFKKQNPSMQLLHMYIDALRMINGLRYDKKEDIFLQTCEFSPDSFTIRLRIYDLKSLSFPVLWFASQHHAFLSVRPKSRSRVDVEPMAGYPFYISVTYSIWLDDPLPF